MGTYTAYDLPVVDETIDGHLRTLTRICLSALASNLDSVILSGSFGRGEGSVVLHGDGSVEPLRDYDVRIITQRPVPPKVLDEIRSSFMSFTKLGGTHERFSGENGFSLTVEALTVAQLSGPFVRDRDLRAYDHLTASRVIYGTDRAPLLRFPAADIPKVNGLRFLYQKMIGLVGHFGGRNASTDAGGTLLYECNKTWVEMCTALVLLAGAYVPSYRERAERFVDNWQAWFPELADCVPDLGIHIVRATREKLYPGSTTPFREDDAFSQVRASLLAVHRFYVQKLYSLDVRPGRSGCAALRRALSSDYFRMAATQWLRSRGLNIAAGRHLVNAAYHRLLRVRFARGAGRRGLAVVWDTLRSGEAPAIDVFLAAWCALAAAGEPPDDTLLDCAAYALDRLPGPAAPRHCPSGWVHYRTVRERLTLAYSTWERHR